MGGPSSVHFRFLFILLIAWGGLASAQAAKPGADTVAASKMYTFEEIQDVYIRHKKVVMIFDENMNRLVQGRTLQKRGDTLFVADRAIPRGKVAYVTLEDPEAVQGAEGMKAVGGSLMLVVMIPVFLVVIGSLAALASR